jgi:hypothetical protein
MNREYQDKLEAFTRGEVGFKELNSLIASHMLRWLMFDGKGIFRESDARRISLVDEDLRLPIEDISYVNYFPFKTSANRSPFKASSFRGYVWATYIRSLLELLEPTVIIPMGSWYAGSTTTEFRRLAGSPKLIPVWNPSDYNLNTRPWELLTKWEPVSEYLRGLRGSSHH